jgi:putative addiction module component (TIGR02574 family)
MIPTTVESLLQQAKSLSDADREELARRLYDTLPPLPEMPVVWDSEEEAEAAWQDELNRRLDEVASGKTDCIPWDQALAEMQEALRRKHGR